ncbi:MAG: hypothetical protein WBA68_11980 [Alteraurantiacibacter sp.]
MAVLLAGCAVNTPVAITSTTGAVGENGQVMLAEAEDGGTPRAIFASALSEAFTRHGVPLGNKAPLLADFALSERDAETGLVDPESSTEDAIVWTSRNRNRRLFDGCTARRLRATLVLLRRDDGEIAYRGVAETDLCESGEADIRALADALVRDAKGWRPTG